MPPQSIRERLHAVAGTHRRCEYCHRDINTRKYLGGLCPACRHRRRRHGSERVRRKLRRSEWDGLLRHVRLCMRTHKPSAEILASAARLLNPGSMPHPRDQRKMHAPFLWWREMTYRASPESRWPDLTRRGHYKASGIVAILVAVTAYVEEREGVGFPGDAEDTAKARVILDIYKRPKAGKRGRKVPATVVRLLVKRLRAAAGLGVYLLTTARAALARKREEQERIGSRRRRSPPPPRVAFGHELKW